MLHCNGANTIPDWWGHKLINFIIKNNLVQADSPGLCVWSMNAAEQIDAWLAEHRPLAERRRIIPIVEVGYSVTGCNAGSLDMAVHCQKLWGMPQDDFNELVKMLNGITGSCSFAMYPHHSDVPRQSSPEV